MERRLTYRLCLFWSSCTTYFVCSIKLMFYRAQEGDGSSKDELHEVVMVRYVM